MRGIVEQWERALTYLISYCATHAVLPHLVGAHTHATPSSCNDKQPPRQYFPNTAWPVPASISDECGGDPLFLALYNELTLRHLQSVKRPNVRDRIEGWHAYRQLFDLILAEAPKDGEGSKRETLYLIPEWCFDILHEFLYQFQGFCQFRTTTYANAAKKVSDDPDSSLSGHVADALDVLSQNRDAWAVETVLFYLHRLVAVGTKNPSASATYRYLAYFASVTLSRLECLLGDYRASVSALDVIYDPEASQVAVGEDMKTPEELVNGVFPARLSLTYHAGVSYLMLRRYKDSAAILGQICLFMQRGFKVSCGPARVHCVACTLQLLHDPHPSSQYDANRLGSFARSLVPSSSTSSSTE